MKTKIIILTLAVILGFSAKSFAEDKIAYANLEAILAYLPDITTVQEELRKMDSSLAAGITAKRDELQSKLEEAQKAYENKASEEEMKVKQDEITKMQGAIQQQTSEAQKQLVQKRSELMAPVSDKVQKALEAVAAEKGFTYIINGADGTGMSVVLQGPDDRDMTKAVLLKLGVDVDKEAEASAPAVPAAK